MFKCRSIFNSWKWFSWAILWKPQVPKLGTEIRYIKVVPCIVLKASLIAVSFELNIEWKQKHA